MQICYFNSVLNLLWRRRETNGDAEWPTNRQGEYSAICLIIGWKIKGRDLQFHSSILLVLLFSLVMWVKSVKTKILLLLLYTLLSLVSWDMRPISPSFPITHQSPHILKYFVQIFIQYCECWTLSSHIALSVLQLFILQIQDYFNHIIQYFI